MSRRSSSLRPSRPCICCEKVSDGFCVTWEHTTEGAAERKADVAAHQQRADALGEPYRVLQRARATAEHRMQDCQPIDPAARRQQVAARQELLAVVRAMMDMETKAGWYGSADTEDEDDDGLLASVERQATERMRLYPTLGSRHCASARSFECLDADRMVASWTASEKYDGIGVLCDDCVNLLLAQRIIALVPARTASRASARSARSVPAEQATA